jgi:hypothetical protein
MTMIFSTEKNLVPPSGITALAIDTGGGAVWHDKPRFLNRDLFVMWLLWRAG